MDVASVTASLQPVCEQTELDKQLTMAEVVAALALGSSVISFIDIGGKVISRVREYIETSQEVPGVLRDFSDRLETLLLTTKNLESALNAGKLDDGARNALKNTVAGLERQAMVLQGLCEHMLPPLGSSRWKKTRKAVSSFWKEKELKSVLQKIIAYESTLNLYFTTAMSSKDSSTMPSTKGPYQDLPPFPLGRFIGRRRVLERVAASFGMHNSNHRMTTVLLGIGGQFPALVCSPVQYLVNSVSRSRQDNDRKRILPWPTRSYILVLD